MHKVVRLLCLLFLPFNAIAEQLSLTLSDTFKPPQKEISAAFSIDVSKGESHEKESTNLDRDPQKFFEDDVLRRVKRNPMDSPLMPQKDRGRSSYGHAYNFGHNHSGK